MREILERFGYTMLEAGDGREALEVGRFHDGAINLLLTDVVMPAMNGAEFALWLMPERPEMDFLFIYSYTGEAIVRHGVIEPGIPFLGKPFSSVQLAQRLRELLDARHR